MSDGRSGDRTETGPPTGQETPEEPNTGTLTTPAIDDTSRFGLSMTLLTGVLLALGYYGIRSVTEAGLGQAIPAPFYLLALALVFVVELSRSRSFDAYGLARAVGMTAVFGTLVILAVEGGAYLWEHPEAALDEFVGVAVLAVSLVVAALAYALYLSAVETEREGRV